MTGRRKGIEWSQKLPWGEFSGWEGWWEGILTQLAAVIDSRYGTKICAGGADKLLCGMPGFFKRNISFQGRMARGITGSILLIAGIIAADSTLWAAIPLVVIGLFCIFEAVRGWCFLRACGIKTKV
jgi:hypothetical protein